ncbi:MAG: hypothetical protein V4547_18350 [Bacteroidota bacterium]
MKLREYIEEMNNFVRDNPECLDMIVVYGKDEEGNGFDEVSNTPTKGIFTDDDEFTPEDNIEDDGLDVDDINAVCIN